MSLQSTRQSRTNADTVDQASPLPPPRAEHVGSFLRPDFLLDARARHADGELSDSQLREVEDRAIRDVVRLQGEAGLKAITDGEFRRTYFHLDFLQHLAGVETELPRIVRHADGRSELTPPTIRVTGKVSETAPVQVADYRFLQGAVDTLGVPGLRAKVTIPSPTMLHFRGGRAGISRDAYPALEPAFFADLAQTYVDELWALRTAGCTYVQFDDTNLAYLCDDRMREGVRERGDDPDTLPAVYSELINDIVARKPADMLLGVHLCRGNFRSTFAAAGGYAPVAEALFGQMNLDVYFLEYDDERSGDFEPLRYLTGDKYAVLGLITTKSGALESKDDIKRRINEAARIVPMERLCLSPQCGFASTVHGNDISVDAQRAKLALVTEIAREVWGDA
ncbi:MAG: 5-methyltetrahydropteroyltriglutamate--homocysteine S-methyltransferase [Gammaproteobacteria bacterium]|nr:5-methyltetrahydropteroyltriglutamate--homocysteine S-methyltransferase [Gammaproteobacteria bacterium]